MIRNFILCFALLLSASSFAQVFDVNLTPTTETCYGSGAITVTVANTVAGATVDYVLYKMPDTSTAVAFGAVGASGAPDYLHTFTGLVAGDYEVVATQTLGGPLGSQVESVTVDSSGNFVTPLATTYEPWILCGEDGTITVTIAQGTAEYYILRKEEPAGSGMFVDIQGPQDGGETSTIFENLTPGQYRVVIRDQICQNDVVRTVIINPVVIPPVEFGSPELEPSFVDCEASEVTVKQPVLIPYIAFPVEVTFTVYPPDWPTNPEVVLGPFTIEEGDPSQEINALLLQLNIPYYHGEYYYTISVTNQCGQGWLNNSGNIPVLFELEVSARLSEKLCYGIDILVSNGIEAFDVWFLDRDDYYNGIETVVNIGHISEDPELNAFVHSHDNAEVDEDGNPIYVPHPGPFPINSQGAGKVTYGLYDMYFLDGDGNPILDDNGEEIPALVGQYIIKVGDACSPITGIYGYVDLSITDEIAEPNVSLVPMPPLPSPTPDFPDYDPFLDCIPVGGVYINHVMYFDWGEDQDGNVIIPNIGKIEIIDGPDDYKYFLANYTHTDPDDDTSPAYTLPLDITGWVGTPPHIDPNPPFANEVAYEISTTPGVVRPLFHGLVGEGEYTFAITDICGNYWEITEYLENFFAGEAAFTEDIAEGCGDEGSYHLTPNFTEEIGYPVYTYVTSTNPEFYTKFDFMQNGSGAIDFVNAVYDGNPANPLGYWFYVPAPVPGQPGTWQMRVGGLPAGCYEFDVKIGCAEKVFEFCIDGYQQELVAFEMEKYCSQYSLMFDYTSNSSTSWTPQYALEWCSKENIEDCEETDWIDVTPGQMTPGQMINNITSNNGHYRIVKYYKYYYNDILVGAGPSAPDCKVVIHEFEYYDMPGIEDIDVLSCPDGASITIVNATGVEPLTYQLVTVQLDVNGNVIPGSMVVIQDNGHDSVFTGLAPGVHWFNIIDDCAANVIGSATVGEAVELEIIEDNNCDGGEDDLCHGNNGCLSVDNISVLEYTWFKVDTNGAETPVLDQNGNQVTGNQLHFEPYDCNEHTGTYRVYMQIAGNNNLTFCDVNYIDYELSCGQPSAGDDVEVTYCHTNQSIDLAGLLTGGTTSGGDWTDVDGTGALNGSIFDTTGVAFGTYVFHYEVGGCNGYDDSFITINLLDTPELPVAASVCEGEMLSIDNPNSAFTYTWTAPDGTTSTGTSITAQIAGNYTVTATLTGSDCVSPAATVVVKQNPNFTITSITEICTTLTVAGSNFNASEATYVWTFGGNVVGTDVTYVAEEDGDYTVEVTLDGCTSSQTVTVQAPAVAVDYGCVENQFMVFVTNTASFPNATYDWTGPGYSNTGSSINISGLENGVYTVTVTDTDGCTTTGNVTITGTQCVIPKGVSPNGDDINDTFNLSNFNVREVKIFNRYGRTVYEKANGYTNEWYGQSSDDKMLPSATYYYLVTLIDGTQKSGWVYLNRED